MPHGAPADPRLHRPAAGRGAGAIARRRDATRIVYGASLALSLARADRGAGASGLGGGAPTSVVLPLGLPWIGAHFRLDALAAFFLVVVNLGGAAASLYGARLRPARDGAAARAAVLPGLPRRHEPRRAGRRRLHLPVRLGVHVARLLGAGDGAPSRAGQRARRLHLSGDGELRHAGAAARLRPARRARAAATPSRRSAPRTARPVVAGAGAGAGRCSAPARRPASCRCTSGCRSPIRPRRATSRR